MLFPVHDICTFATVKIWYETFLYIFLCLWYSCLPTNSPYILDYCWSAMAESCWTHRKSSTLPMWSILAMHPMWWVHKILSYMSLCLEMTLVMPPVTYSKLSVSGVLFLLRAVTWDEAPSHWVNLCWCCEGSWCLHWTFSRSVWPWRWSPGIYWAPLTKRQIIKTVNTDKHK